MRALRVIVLSILSTMILVSSCDMINPPEEIPSFIKIDTFLLEVIDIDQGAPTHMITNCYVSAGGTNLGIFQMPFEIPSLNTGLLTLYIRPGIKLNGISASRIDYPFFNPYIIDYELKRGETHLISPVTTYKDECLFPWIEDFEDAGLSVIYPDYSDTIVITQNEMLRSGRYSGAIFVDKENPLLEAVSNEFFELPQNGSPVLLEFDYINNNGFEIGMYILEDGATEWYNLVYIKPSQKWKRFYVDIGQSATIRSSADKFRMGIRVFHEPENNESGEVFLDNIKLIHF